MSGINIVVDDEGVLRALRLIQSKSLRLRPLLLSIGEALRDSTEQRFTTSTAPNGQRWAANRPSTIAAKGSNKPNVHHGVLRNSVNYSASESVLELKSDRNYAAFAQFGTRAHKIKPKRGGALAFIGAGGASVFAKSVNHPGTPARPFLGISNEDRREIIAEAREYLLVSKNGT